MTGGRGPAGDTRIMDIRSDQAAGQRRVGRWMFGLMWLVVLGLLTLGFHDYLAQQRNPNKHFEQTVGADGARVVVLQRNRYGHYVASGSINGQPVEFILDTGATDVAVPEGVARRLKLQRGAPARYETANGTAMGYTTRLSVVRLGTIELRNVRASINPGMADGQVLLGMSFLRNLDFSQSGDRLTLIQRP